MLIGLRRQLFLTVNMHLRGATTALLSLGMLLPCIVQSGTAGAAEMRTPSPLAQAPSPSDPPFWARPRPVAPTSTPACDCGDAIPEERKPFLSPGLIALATASIALLLFIWRWARPRPRPSTATRASPYTPVRRTAAPVRVSAADAPTMVLPVFPAHVERVLETPEADHIELSNSEEEPTSADSLKFYSDVANSLSEAIEKNPGRLDLWRKLFEVYSTSKMANQYVNLAYSFLDRHNGRSNPHWHDIGIMGRQLLPEHELFREFGDKAASPRTLQFRRYYDQKLDQGALFRAQEKLEAGYNEVRKRSDYQALLRKALVDGAQRPSPIAPVPVIDLGSDGARIYLKREDRRRAHDDVLINAIGQVMLAQHLGHRQVLTATRDGTHGLATATVAARLGLECVVYISEHDLRAHYARVLSLRRLGAQVRPVRTDPESRFSDPRQYALTEWIENADHSQYICGLSGGPQPFPMIVGELQASIGIEAAEQMQRMTGRLPGAVVTHARDGYFGLGLLRGFLEHPTVKLYCVDAPDPDHIDPEHEAADSLREYRWLRDTGRVTYLDGNDSEGMRIIEQFHGAGTPLHAATGRTLAHARQIALQSEPDDAVLVAYGSQEGTHWRGGSAN